MRRSTAFPEGFAIQNALQYLYDRMKTAVIGEDEAVVVTYNASLVALLNHYGAVPRACQPYRAKTKGKVERPFRYIRQDFFLARTFRNMADLNGEFDAWRTEVANPRVHATTRRVVDDAFAEEVPHLTPLPEIPYSAVLSVERRVSKDGMIAVGGNFYSVPDTTRRRTLEVQNHATELLIYEDGQLIARHPELQGKARRRVDPAHRKAPPPGPALSRSAQGLRRPLEFYGAVGQRLAADAVERRLGLSLLDYRDHVRIDEARLRGDLALRLARLQLEDTAFDILRQPSVFERFLLVHRVLFYVTQHALHVIAIASVRLGKLGGMRKTKASYCRVFRSLRSLVPQFAGFVLEART
jgi:hypothetical protein